MPPKTADKPFDVVLAFPNGDSVTLGFGDTPCKDVVVPLVRGIAALSNTGGPIGAGPTAVSYGNAVRHFARWLDQRGWSGTICDVNDHLWRSYLLDASTTARQESCLAALLRQVGDMHELESTLRRRLDVGRPLLGKPKSTPLRALSAGEAARLRAACKQEVVALEERLAVGRDLLADGRDPRVHGLSDANLLWLYNEFGPCTKDEVRDIVGRHVGYARRWTRRRDGVAAFRAPTELLSMLFPSGDDLVPFVILLGLGTGLPPEGIRSFKVDSAQRLGNNIVRLSYHKARGGGDMADNFSDRTQWSPGHLFDRVIAATAASRRHLPEEESLWVLLSLDGMGIRANPKAFGPSRDRLVARHHLQFDDGRPMRFDFRQLRKTFAARQNKHFGGDPNLAAGSNQTAQVNADHYLASGVETEQLSQTIEATQAELIARAARAAKPMVIDEPELAVLRSDGAKASRRLGVPEARARELVSGEAQDVFAAKCRDHHNSPFGRPGQACPAAAWECLLCTQALVTPTKLPNILRLRDHVLACHKSMPKAEWEQRWGSIDAAILDVLDQFSPEVIEAARAKAAEALLYLRPEDHIT